MGRRGYVPLRRIGDVPLRCCLVFYLRLVWDIMKTYWWDVVVKICHWDVLAMFHRDVLVCFIWDIQRRLYDVIKTSCCWVGLVYVNNIVFTFCLYKIAINYLLSPFFTLFFHLYKIISFYFFCFPNIINYILNIASAIKKMTVNELRDFVLKTIINELYLLKKKVICCCLQPK